MGRESETQEIGGRSYFPRWLSPVAFFIVTGGTAAAMFNEAARLGFSTEAIAQLVVGSLVSGIFWGAVLTWIARRYFWR